MTGQDQPTGRPSSEGALGAVAMAARDGRKTALPGAKTADAAGSADSLKSRGADSLIQLETYPY